MDLRRIMLVLVGALIASGGIVVLTKSIRFQADAVRASAKILELKSDCFISRLQADRGQWSREPIDCAAEPELKRTLASQKNIYVFRNDTATVEFPLKNGSLLKTEVSQQPYTRTGSLLRVGDTLPVIYDPTSPRIARAPMGILDVLVALTIFAFGVVCSLVGLMLGAIRRYFEAKFNAAPASSSPVNMRPQNAAPVRQARVAFATRGSAAPRKSDFSRR